jgi:hypothetical protein
LGALRRQVVIDAGPHALQVSREAGVVEVIAGALLRCGRSGLLRETIEQVQLANDCRQMLLFITVVGRCCRQCRRQADKQQRGA